MLNEINNQDLIASIKNLKENNNWQNQNSMINEALKAKYITPVNIDALKNNEGSLSLEKDSKINFQLLENQQGKHFFMAFTDTNELKKWQNNQEQQTLIINFDDFAKMILKDNSDSAGFVINPFNQNISFNKEIINALKNGASPEIIVKNTKLIIKEIKNHNQSFIDGLKDIFKSLPETKKAFLLSMKKDNVESMLLLIDCENENKTLGKIAGLISSLAFERPVNIASYNSDFARSATKNIKPLFEK